MNITKNQRQYKSNGRCPSYRFSLRRLDRVANVVQQKNSLHLLIWILRRVFAPKKDENAEYRRLYNDEFHNLYSSPNIFRAINSRRLRWVGHIARMEEGRSAFKILKAKPTGKRPLGRPRRRWEDNIRMDLEEIGINAGNWVDSAQDRDYWRALVNAALNLRVP